MLVSEPNFDMADLIDGDDSVVVKDSDAVEVVTPSGLTIEVMGQAEADFYNQMRDRYGQDNKLKNVSDFLELDRILLMETMSFRWGQWLLSGSKYDGSRINPKEIQTSISSYSKEIREIKGALGIDKVTRDKDKGSNFAEFMNMLSLRAKEFGVHRDNQIVEAINMLNEFFAAATASRNMNEREQKEFNMRADDVIDLILSREKDYQKIDEQFKKNQKIWIRDING